MEALQETHEYKYSKIELGEFRSVLYNIPQIVALLLSDRNLQCSYQWKLKHQRKKALSRGAKAIYPSSLEPVCYLPTVVLSTESRGISIEI
jgi:hypothetical protein